MGEETTSLFVRFEKFARFLFPPPFFHHDSRNVHHGLYRSFLSPRSRRARRVIRNPRIGMCPLVSAQPLGAHRLSLLPSLPFVPPSIMTDLDDVMENP